jgi:serine/threonine-protein kinase
VAKAKLAKIPDWLVGLTLTLAIAALFFLRLDFLTVLDAKLFDLRMKLLGARPADDRIAIVAIDDESIAKLGRWPWPRSRMAAAVNVLREKGPRVIGFTVLFSEPEESSGLVALQALEKEFLALGLGPAGAPFLEKVRQLKTDLSNDEKLAASLRQAGNVILPLAFVLDQRPRPPGRSAAAGETGAVPPELARSAFNSVEAARLDAAPYLAERALWPLPAFTAAAAGFGHTNKVTDRDGVGRAEVLAIEYAGKYYPSFAFAAAARFLGMPANKITLRLGEGIETPAGRVPADPRMRMLINYYGGERSFPRYSFYDVLNEKITGNPFQDRLVLIGATAAGLADLQPSPLAPALPGVEKHASVIANILEANYLTRPPLAGWVELGLILGLGLLSALLLPRLSARWGSILAAALFLVLLGVVLSFHAARGIWVGAVLPALVLLANYLAITSRRFLMVEREKQVVEGESAEASKMLGLTFQSQGMLDLAFEKFQRLPVNQEMKGILYNLGMDFERKRMAGKALAVYERIAAAGSHYKDVVARIEHLKRGAIALVGAGLPGRAGDATLAAGGMARPTLGRYELLEELGRGAMGVVYKGRDPKINRLVAIKTVQFDQFEDALVPQVKARFFREAQSAGQLNHPNILTVYDAGEEMDLAYIAMELIEGKNLTEWCRPGRLLPWPQVVDIAAKVAEALHYAHQRGIVHRDIKPANIMLLGSGQVKVTDFGIARIQAVSQTKTGAVLGTPSYMSPEQVSGQKVDGRTDLFSLGIVLFEMLAGERPFPGDSVATIMFQIAQAEPANLAQRAPGLPPELYAVAGKALCKTLNQRFQTGAEFAAALRACAARAPVPAG